MRRRPWGADATGAAGAGGATTIGAAEAVGVASGAGASEVGAVGTAVGAAMGTTGWLADPSSVADATVLAAVVAQAMVERPMKDRAAAATVVTL